MLARGQPIGTLELAGSHCFPLACLHWGWLRGSTYLDPLALVGGGPIVLLPLWSPLIPAPTPSAGRPTARILLPLPYDPVLAELAQARRHRLVTMTGSGTGPTPWL